MKKSTMILLAAWPTNEALPQSVLDLYGSSNLSSRAWAFLSSHPATNPPASFSVDPAALPWYDQAGALVVLGRLLGINVEYKYMTRFGYINPTALVDISPCNNPFYPITTSHEPMTGGG